MIWIRISWIGSRLLEPILLFLLSLLLPFVLVITSYLSTVLVLLLIVRVVLLIYVVIPTNGDLLSFSLFCVLVLGVLVFMRLLFMLILILLNLSVFGMENHRVSRFYSIFESQLHLEVFCDDVKILVIDVDLDSLQFSTSIADCKLDVLAKESSYIVKLRSYLMGDC